MSGHELYVEQMLSRKDTPPASKADAARTDVTATSKDQVADSSNLYVEYVDGVPSRSSKQQAASEKDIVGKNQHEIYAERIPGVSTDNVSTSQDKDIVGKNKNELYVDRVEGIREDVGSSKQTDEPIVERAYLAEHQGERVLADRVLEDPLRAERTFAKPVTNATPDVNTADDALARVAKAQQQQQQHVHLTGSDTPSTTPDAESTASSSLAARLHESPQTFAEAALEPVSPFVAQLSPRVDVQASLDSFSTPPQSPSRSAPTRVAATDPVAMPNTASRVHGAEARTVETEVTHVSQGAPVPPLATDVAGAATQVQVATVTVPPRVKHSEETVRVHHESTTSVDAAAPVISGTETHVEGPTSVHDESTRVHKTTVEPVAIPPIDVHAASKVDPVPPVATTTAVTTIAPTPVASAGTMPTSHVTSTSHVYEEEPEAPQLKQLRVQVQDLRRALDKATREATERRHDAMEAERRATALKQQLDEEIVRRVRVEEHMVRVGAESPAESVYETASDEEAELDADLHDADYPVDLDGVSPRARAPSSPSSRGTDTLGDTALLDITDVPAAGSAVDEQLLAVLLQHKQTLVAERLCRRQAETMQRWMMKQMSPENLDAEREGAIVPLQQQLADTQHKLISVQKQMDNTLAGAREAELLLRQQLAQVEAERDTLRRERDEAVSTRDIALCEAAAERVKAQRSGEAHVQLQRALLLKQDAYQKLERVHAHTERALVSRCEEVARLRRKCLELLHWRAKMQYDNGLRSSPTAVSAQLARQLYAAPTRGVVREAHEVSVVREVSAPEPRVTAVTQVTEHTAPIPSPAAGPNDLMIERTAAGDESPGTASPMETSPHATPKRERVPEPTTHVQTNVVTSSV